MRALFFHLRGGNIFPCSASPVLDEDFSVFAINARGDDVRHGAQCGQNIFGCIAIVKREGSGAVGANNLGKRGEVASQGLPGGEEVVTDEYS